MIRGYSTSRDVMPNFLQAFDVDDGRAPCPMRTQTVTAPQALFMMNSDEIEKASAKFAERLQKESGGDLKAAVDLGYRLDAVGRPPSACGERTARSSYLENDPARLKGLAWLLFNLDEFIYVQVIAHESEFQPLSLRPHSGAASSTRPAADSSALALGALWAEAGETRRTLHLGPHFTPKAKSVIFLFMCGGVSHIDTFDPKDNKWAGKLIDAVGFGDNVAEMKRPVIPCLRTFTRYGKSRHPGLRLVPARRRRDRRDRRRPLDVVPRGQSLPGRHRDHAPVTAAGSSTTRRSAAGSPTRWAAPTRICRRSSTSAAPSSPVQLTGGYLGATVAATPFQPGETPIPNLYPPEGEQRRRARAADAGARSS